MPNIFAGFPHGARQKLLVANAGNTHTHTDKGRRAHTGPTRDIDALRCARCFIVIIKPKHLPRCLPPSLLRAPLVCATHVALFACRYRDAWCGSLRRLNKFDMASVPAQPSPARLDPDMIKNCTLGLSLGPAAESCTLLAMINCSAQAVAVPREGRGGRQIKSSVVGCFGC